MAKSAFGDDLIEDGAAPVQGAVSAFGDSFVDESPVQQSPAVQPNDYRAMANAAAVKYQLDPRLFAAQINQESRFDPKAVSKAGAQGLGQLMPGTARDLGVTDPFDPAQNLDASARYMRQLMDRYDGDTDRALAAYNWGMGNVDKYGLKMLPKETRNYLASIKGNIPQQQAVPQAPAADQRAVEDQTREMILGAQYRQGRPAPGTPLANQINAETQSIAAGLTSAADASGQLVSAAMPDQLERLLMPGGQTFNERFAGRDQAITEQRQASGLEGPSVGYGLGVLASPANALVGPAAQGLSRAAQVGPRATRVLESAIGGGLGAATTPVIPDEEGGVMGTKAAQVAAGAVLGPVVEGAGRAVVNTAGRLAGALKNKMAMPEVQALDDLSKKWGVDLLAGDYDTNRRLIRGIEGRLINSQIPGLNINLEAQQAQGREAARKFLNVQADQLKNLSYTSLDKIQQIAGGSGPRAKEAQSVLRMVDEAGTDARKIIQASGNMKWLRMKLSADQLYDDVERLAGSADVQPIQTLKAVEKAIKDAGGSVNRDNELLQRLAQWDNNLQAGPMTGQANTYARMRDFRSDVQSFIDGSSTNGTVRSSRTALAAIKTAIERDMDAFADSVPALKAANDKANAFYQSRVVPFQKDTLARALRSDNPDDIYRSFVRSGAEWKGDHMQEQLFRALDDKGKAAVRAGIVEDAFRQATDPENFSPVGFNKIMRSTGYEKFFQGPARREVDGLMHIIDHISRSDPARLATFQPMIGNLAGAGALTAAAGGVNPVAVAGGLVGTGAMKWLVTTEAGRRLLYSANLYKPGTAAANKAMAEILDKATREMGKAAGTAAGLETGQPGTVLP